MSNEAAGGRPEWAVSLRLALFVFVFFAGLTHGHFKTSDEWTVFEASVSIWDEGRPTVYPGPFTHRGPDGRLYSQYMLGQSVLALPFVLVGRMAGTIVPESLRVILAGPTMTTAVTAMTGGEALAGGRPEIMTVTLFAPAMTALLVAICALQQRQLGVSMKNAVRVSLLIGMTSYVAMHATYFLRHSTTTMLLMGALLAFQQHRQYRDRASLFVGASMAALIPLVRLPDAILGLPLAFFVAWILREHFKLDGLLAIRRFAPVILLPPLVALSLYAATNEIRWGAWFASPILSYSSDFDFPILEGIRGFLFSPGVSIFLYSPLLVLMPWSLVALARRDRVFFFVCLGTSVWLLLFYSKWEYWPGLPTAPGPRYLFAVSPLLLMSLGPWLEEARGRWPWRVVSILAVVGAIVQAALVLADWRAIRALLGIADEQAPWNSVFILELSPILGALRSVAAGELNSMLWRIGQGWPGFEPRLGLAIALASLWLIALAAIGRALLRAVRDA